MNWLHILSCAALWPWNLLVQSMIFIWNVSLMCHQNVAHHKLYYPGICFWGVITLFQPIFIAMQLTKCYNSQGYYLDDWLTRIRDYLQCAMVGWASDVTALYLMIWPIAPPQEELPVKYLPSLIIPIRMETSVWQVIIVIHLPYTTLFHIWSIKDNVQLQVNSYRMRLSTI